MKLFSLLNSILISLAAMILAFAVLSWAKVPVGNLTDWVSGLLAFFWLLAIVTEPWNIYFKAKAVLSDAQPTRERGLPVDERQVAYVRKLAVLSFWIAIGLHLASAIVLYLLARTGVVRIGYIASVIALMLTILRPSISAYEYLAARLHAIGQNWVYPRADVVELRGRVTSLEASLKSVRDDSILRGPIRYCQRSGFSPRKPAARSWRPPPISKHFMLPTPKTTSASPRKPARRSRN